MMNLLHKCDSTSLYIYVCLLEEKWCQSCTCGLWKMMGLAVWPFQFLKAFVFISFPQFSFLFFPVEPEIQVDKVWVHADVSVEVEISCIVHAEPMAEVSNDTYDKCTLYQGYGNRYNLIKCWHIFQQQRTIVRTATGIKEVKEVPNTLNRLCESQMMSSIFPKYSVVVFVIGLYFVAGSVLLSYYVIAAVVRWAQV